MSQPFRYWETTVSYYCPLDEAVLLVRWAKRGLFVQPLTPFTDHVILSLYELHRSA